jgi:hypothetical protein
VQPAGLDDAHVSYVGQPAALHRILSVHTPRRLSSNLSCQYKGLLYQVQGSSKGLAMRGADVTVVTHPGSETEIVWQGRVLSHTCSSKAVRQGEAVDGKEVNSKVALALNTRRTPPPPIGHPWKQRMTTAPGAVPIHAEFAPAKASLSCATP